MKRIPITEEQFRVFFGNPDWRVTEIPQERIEQITDLPRRSDVVAVYSSGDISQTRILNGVSSVLGMDVIAQETRPKKERKEPELNVYHVVVQKLQMPVHDYRYLMHVAYTGETLFGHWRGVDVLDEYIIVAQSRFGEFFSTTGFAPQVQHSGS